MRIRRNYWKGWVRLALRAVVVAGIWYGFLGVWFGVERITGNDVLNDGDIVLYCRIGCEYNVGDLAIANNGEVIRIGEKDNTGLAGKIIARLSVRGFDEGARDY